MIKNRLFINDKLRVPITNCCNFSCFYCHNEGQLHKQESSFMSLDFIKGLKSFITKNNVYINELNITGGEPLLHPNLLEIVALLKNVSNNLCIITNGSLLTKQKIDDFNKIIIKLNLTYIKYFFKHLWNICQDFPYARLENLNQLNHASLLLEN